MASPYERPDKPLLGDIERLLGHLTDELGAWRRRCQKAETELAALRAGGGMVPGDDVNRTRARVLDLERENLELRARIDRAHEMVSGLQQRLAFLDDDAPVEASS